MLLAVHHRVMIALWMCKRSVQARTHATVYFPQTNKLLNFHRENQVLLLKEGSLPICNA